MQQLPVGVFEPNNPICQNCWRNWVKAQCKGETGEFDRCDKYYEGCTECLESFCQDGAHSGICDLEEK